jgi:hypothetical protein
MLLFRLSVSEQWMKVQSTSNNLSIKFSLLNYCHDYVNRAHAHCKHVIWVYEDDNTLPMCRGPECRSFTITPFKVELKYQFYICCTFYFLCLFCCICISDNWLFIKRWFFITVMSTVEQASSLVTTHQQWHLLYIEQSSNKK